MIIFRHWMPAEPLRDRNIWQRDIWRCSCRKRAFEVLQALLPGYRIRWGGFNMEWLSTFTQINGHSTLVYSNNIVICFPNPKRGIGHIRIVPGITRKTGATLIMKYCMFFTQMFHYHDQFIQLGQLKRVFHSTHPTNDLQDMTRVMEQK